MILFQQLYFVWKRKTISKACADLKISPGTVSNWKTRNSLPTGEMAIKMAQYFGTTTDVILGYESINFEIKLSDSEKLLIETFRSDKEFMQLIRLSKYAELFKDLKS